MNLLSVAAPPPAAGAGNGGKADSSGKGSAEPGAFDSLLRAGSSPAPGGSAAGPAAEKPAETIAPEPATSRPTGASGDTDAPGEHDVWPPLGLSAILLPPPADSAPPIPPSTGGQLPAGNAGASAAMPQIPAATANLAADTGPLAAARPETGAPVNEIELQPMALVPEADVIADGPDLAPAPPTLVLQGVSAPLDIRSVVASHPFTGSPTATPDLSSEGFDDAIGARLSWLADQKIGHAQIRITPHDLGQVDVKLQLDGDRVHATFTSAHADVRHALENSLPRLREMLGEQGLQLAHADVGEQSTPQDQESGGKEMAGSRDDVPGAPGAADSDVSTRLLHRRGLLDAYA